MACGAPACVERRRREAAAKAQAQGKSTGKYSVTLTETGPMGLQGQRFFFDNMLAAMAFNVDAGGKNTVRGPH